MIYWPQIEMVLLVYFYIIVYDGQSEVTMQTCYCTIDTVFLIYQIFALLKIVLPAIPRSEFQSYNNTVN